MMWKIFLSPNALFSGKCKENAFHYPGFSGRGGQLLRNDNPFCSSWKLFVLHICDHPYCYQFQPSFFTKKRLFSREIEMVFYFCLTVPNVSKWKMLETYFPSSKDNLLKTTQKCFYQLIFIWLLWRRVRSIEE